MKGHDSIGDLIAGIYDSVDSEHGWMPVLGDIARDFDSGGVHLFLRNHVTGEFLEDSYYGDHSDALKREFQRLLPTDPTWPIAIRSPGKIVNCVEHYGDRIFENTPAYNEVFRHIGCRYRMTCTLPVSQELVAGVAVTHLRETGAFTPEDVMRLEYLLPHMLRAVRLQRRLRALERDAEDIVAALDRLPTGALIVSSELEIICLNQQAERLLSDCEGLCVRRSRLVPTRSAEACALREAIRETSALADGGLDGPKLPPQVVRIRRPDKLALELLAAPLRPRYRMRQKSGQKARALLLIYDPTSHPRVDPTLLERLFELTRTEAIIAARLAEGRTIAEVSKERRCSAATVRSHVKQIFQKTRTNRQAELVQLLLTGPAVSTLPS